MCRCLLIPCVGSCPNVELDVLSDILVASAAAFPDALGIGHTVSCMDAEDIYDIRDRLRRLIGCEVQDSRLLTHYSLLIAHVKEV